MQLPGQDRKVVDLRNAIAGQCDLFLPPETLIGTIHLDSIHSFFINICIDHPYVVVAPHADALTSRRVGNESAVDSSVLIVFERDPVP